MLALFAATLAGVLLAVFVSRFVFFVKVAYDKGGRAMPTLPVYTWLGSAMALAPVRENRMSVNLLKLARTMKDGLPLLVARLPGYDLVHLASASVVAPVLKASHHSMPKGPKYESMHAALGASGLVTANGHTWQVARKLISPAFHAGRLKSMYGKFLAHVETQVELWQPLEDGAEVDFHLAMSALTADVVADAAFGFDLNTKSDSSTPLGKAIADVLEEMHLRFGDVTKLPRLFFWGERQRRFKESRALLFSTVQQIIDARMEEDAEARPEEKRDLLDHLIDAVRSTDEPLPGDFLRSHSMTFLGAGHETTANALSWTMLEMCKHPDVYARMQDEVDRVLGGRRVSYEDHRHMEYMDRVFKESMRLHPPITIIGREALEPVQVGKFTLPEGSRLLLNLRGVHMDPEQWPEPERFDPDRFLRERSKERHRLAHVPFSAGPRSCIGQRFAELEMVCIMSTLLQHYDFELVSHEPVLPYEAVTSRPMGGLFVRVRKRRKV